SKAGVIDSIISSMIIGTTGSWVYYPEENKWGYKIPVENEIAKALIKNRDLNTKYILVDDGANVQIKNGLYRITDGILDAYYAFDENGRMLTGFMVTTEDTKTYSINPLTQEVELIGYPGPGKYYLMEAGQYMGGMCTSPITFNNITYIFDQSGKVIMEIKNIIDNAGAWEYKADVNKWVYNKIDADGTITMLKDGVFAIPTLDGIYYYIFDENGYMKTGLTEYNGQTFYLQEEGLLQGAVYTGDLFKDGKVYSFSSTTGELVNIVDAASQVIPIIQ
ncbi:MAG: hypothetical protein IKP66_09965, partial [Lachnospiraceae bacterium]|nr:hypothetical protein [Lachnospiraceae bacterium]